MSEVSEEFMRLVHEVADDGELTVSEIRSLAQWINENRDQRALWPVNGFYPLLKSVFSDGKVDKSELLQIARLVQTSIRHYQRLRSASNSTTVMRPSIFFDPKVAKLPTMSGDFTIPSESEDGVSYQVQLSGPQCSCPDFLSMRAQLPVGDISRCCKHIMGAYATTRPSGGWPSWLDSLLEGGFRPFPKQRWKVIQIANTDALVSSPEPTWGNLYVRIGDESKRYGYSINEDRWSYGMVPPDAAVAEKAIRSFR